MRKIDKIFLVHHSHMDIGFTDFASAVRKRHLEYIDQAVEHCQRSSDNPPSLRLKWTIESSWVVEEYIAKRNPKQVQALVDLIHRGQIEVTGFYTQLLTDLASPEEIIRSVYFANYLRKRYDVHIDSAMINDIGGFTWCLPQVLEKSGIRYLCAGPGGFGVLIPLSKLPRLFYWKSRDGSKVLFWQIGFDRGISLDNVKTYEDFPAQYGFGDDYFTRPFSESPEEGKEKLESLLDRMEREEYPYDAILLQSGADNRGITPELIKTIADWNENIKTPWIMTSTLSEFFNYMEGKYGGKIPEFSGEISDPWSDRANTKARETGIYRSCQNESMIIEKLSAIVSVLNPGYKYPKEEIDKIYENILLYTDHTYGLNMWGWQDTWRKVGSITDSAFDEYRRSWEDKSQYALDAKKMIDGLLDSIGNYMLSKKGVLGEKDVFPYRRNDIYAEGIGILGKNHQGFSLKVKPAKVLLDGYKCKRDKVTVFNPLSFTRSDILELDGTAFYAKDVPPLGFKDFEIGKKDDNYGKLRVGHNSIENDFYRIEIDGRGCIRSIYDKELKLGLVDNRSPHAVNEFIFSEVHGIPESVTRAGIPKCVYFVYHSSTIVSIEKGKDGPLTKSLIVKSKGVNFPVELQLEQEIVLYSCMKRIDFINRIKKEENPDKEAIYFAFPFNVPNCAFHCELPDAIMEVTKDQLDGSHTDFQAVQHWVDVSNNDFGITWVPHESPLVEFGEIRTHKWAGLSYKPQRSWIYAYVMNNHLNTDTPPWQGGEFVFSFSMTTHKGGYESASAVRFGWGCTNPMIANMDLDIGTASFCRVEPENIFLLTFKQAEDKDGYIMRLWDIEGKDTTAVVYFPVVKPKKAFITDLVENNREEIEVINGGMKLSLKGSGLTTVRVRF